MTQTICQHENDVVDANRDNCKNDSLCLRSRAEKQAHSRQQTNTAKPITIRQETLHLPRQFLNSLCHFGFVIVHRDQRAWVGANDLDHRPPLATGSRCESSVRENPEHLETAARGGGSVHLLVGRQSLHTSISLRNVSLRLSLCNIAINAHRPYRLRRTYCQNVPDSRATLAGRYAIHFRATVTRCHRAPNSHLSGVRPRQQTTAPNPKTALSLPSNDRSEPQVPEKDSRTPDIGVLKMSAFFS